MNTCCVPSFGLRLSALSGLGLAALFAAGIGLPATRAQADPGAACVIMDVAGTAEVSARGAGRREAVAGVELGRNASLRTGTEGRVRMTCPDGLEVVVGPESEIAVSGFLDGAERPFGLRLKDGIAGFLFDRAGGDGVQVRTPSAVAAVRSTEWAMRVEGRTSAVFARDGTVFVLARDGSARLQAGDGVDVAADGTVAPVQRWGRARIDLLSGLLGPGW